MNINYFEEYQKLYTEWQTKLYDTWMNSFPMGKSLFMYPDSYWKSLEYQQSLVKYYLEAQETATKVTLDNQKKFWDGYFEFMKKPMMPMV